MSEDYLFLGLIALGGFLLYMVNKRPHILLSLADGLLWFSMFMWLFIDSTPPIGIVDDSNWQVFLLVVFLLLTFIPFVWLMDTEIKHEAHGQSWSEYGDKPRSEAPTNYELYRRELRRRLRR
jgi:hypothetical protein